MYFVIINRVCTCLQRSQSSSWFIIDPILTDLFCFKIIIFDCFEAVRILLLIFPTERNSGIGILRFNIESEKTHLLFVLEGINVPSNFGPFIIFLHEKINLTIIYLPTGIVDLRRLLFNWVDYKLIKIWDNNKKKLSELSKKANFSSKS